MATHSSQVSPSRYIGICPANTSQSTCTLNGSTRKWKTHRRINTLNRLDNLQALRLLLVGKVEVGIRHNDDANDDQ